MDRPKTVCFDFDGVISTYEGWKGEDVFGEPNPDVLKVMSDLHSRGFLIVIFTTRLATPALRGWLKSNSVVYDTINSTKHNPPNTSNKPIADAYVDDRAINYDGQDWRCLQGEIWRLVEEGNKRKHHLDEALTDAMLRERSKPATKGQGEV